MTYLEVITSVGPIATAGALIWAFVQHRVDNKQLKKQLEHDREKYIQERNEFEKLQIDSQIQKLNQRVEQYAGIILITEKLKWALARIKNEVSKENEIIIEKYESHFENISCLLNGLEPWQQSIIGELPIDPLINKYYSYYEYTSSNDLLSWVEHFENQVEEAAVVASEMTEKFTETINFLQDKSLEL